MRIEKLLVGALMAFAIGACTVHSHTDSSTPAASNGASAGLEYGIDRNGSDFRDFDLAEANPALCQQACNDDAQCVAFTYVNPGVQGPAARCWLKDSVPPPSEADCCVSGVK